MQIDDNSSSKSATARPSILKHILLSNILMLMLSFVAAYYVPSFSNQL